MEQQLIEAVNDGDAEVTLALLRDNPRLDVNWIGDTCWSALHSASANGFSKIVENLLAHPAIEVNVPARRNTTPFSLACLFGKVLTVRLLLKDPRVDITLADEYDHTPLWWASRSGHPAVIEWIIASGRDSNPERKGQLGEDGDFLSPLEVARRCEKAGAVSLLERFTANPVQTRHEVRAKLGMLDALAADLFAITIFIHEDLLQLNPTAITLSPNATLFFAITLRLPMELQMILCHRAVGSAKGSILSKDSEVAFKALARILSSPQK